MKKFRMNMIVGKKQIILAALVLCLSLAVYLNWVYSGDGFELPTTSTLETTLSTSTSARMPTPSLPKRRSADRKPVTRPYRP